ncbi:uncharacterized protein SCHCODRAFT_02706425 [Schizophyllum commune H4-8]|nr:uncharacterized protein SCHCODRAFT_02706425 [Schizophyllum commune H4-8]KAI5886026.1 hypothetical protein SCHCODRAFT_02706425 [Schizophyllum commune H4-8]
MTALLAQRLDELALANKDGLLSDDEYRLLRQSAFERFTQDGQADLPKEAHVVPVMSLQVPQHRPHASTSLPGVYEPEYLQKMRLIAPYAETRAPSPHRVEFSPHSPRPHSMMSMKSDAVLSASGSTPGKPAERNKVAGLMRRATSRRRLKPDQPPKDDDGKKGSRFVSGLTKLLSPRKERRSKSVDPGPRRGPPSSVRTKRASSPGSPSKASRRTAGPSEPGSPTSPTYPTSPKTRPSIFSTSTHASSKGSLFSLGSPLKASRKPSFSRRPSSSRSKPSSIGLFSNSASTSASNGSPTKAISSRSTALTPELLAALLTDETNLAEARPAEIRRAIDGVEEERRVVLDAFEGLEMSVLARMQRQGHLSSHAGAWTAEWGIRRTSVPQSASTPLQPPASPLRLSVAAPARMRANSSPRRPTHARARLGSTAGQSFVSTAGQSFVSTAGQSFVSTQSHISASATGMPRHSRQQGSITSMVSFSAPSGDAEEDDRSMDELEDVRRRRGEVVARYEARLEYLRALMRGAEIRERVRR